MTWPGGLDTIWGWTTWFQWPEWPHYLRPIRLIQTISSTTSLPIPLVAPGSVRVDLVTPNAITQEPRLPCQPSFRDGLPDLLKGVPTLSPRPYATGWARLIRWVPQSQAKFWKTPACEMGGNLWRCEAVT